MKTNKMMRIASVLLVAVLLTTCVISGTFAKYTSSIEGTSDAARVAKWVINFTDAEDATLANNFEFDLFETINDYGDGNNDSNGAEQDVADGLIAPGTSGSFVIKLENASEVNAAYTVTLTEVNTAGVPIEYSFDGLTWSTAGNLGTEFKTTGTLDMIDGETTDKATITVQWRWAFDGANDNDFAAGTATVQTTATVAVEQIN